MLNSKIATASAQGREVIVVLIQNHDYDSIGALSELVGAERFGTSSSDLGPTLTHLEVGDIPEAFGSAGWHVPVVEASVLAGTRAVGGARKRM